MDRRGFLRSIGLGIGGIALEQAIPLGRVWSFPKKIVIARDPFELSMARSQLATWQWIHHREMRELVRLHTLINQSFNSSMDAARITHVDKNRHIIALDYPA